MASEREKSQGTLFAVILEILERRLFPFFHHTMFNT